MAIKKLCNSLGYLIIAIEMTLLCADNRYRLVTWLLSDLICTTYVSILSRHRVGPALGPRYKRYILSNRITHFSILLIALI